MNVAVENSYPSSSFQPAAIYDIAPAQIRSKVPIVQFDSIRAAAEALEADIEFVFPNLDCSFGFQTTDIHWSLDSNEILFDANLDGGIWVTAALKGKWLKSEVGEPTFHLDGFSLHLKEKSETPLAIYVCSTFWALLGLSEPFNVRIPGLKYDFESIFELPLKQVSKLLQERQIAYRMMVVEVAIGITLPFPNGYISAEDVENIAFCYHAISDREFDWPTFLTSIPWQADEQTLALMPKSGKPQKVVFQPEFVTKQIFGIDVPLGVVGATVEELSIDNFDEVKERLERLDGATVEVRTRNMKGITRITALRVPRVPVDAWSPKLRDLIKLEETLNKRILEDYFKKATYTLDGLTDEQKEAITARPELDEEAFAI